MTIATRQYEGIGARMYLPEGPFGAAGQTPFPSFQPGTVVAGAYESEFVYIYMAVEASMTVNQGDVFCWDNSYYGGPTINGSAQQVLGMGVGTAYFGGRFGDTGSGNVSVVAGNTGPQTGGNASQGNIWQYVFATPGVYGIWVQRSGASVINTTGGVTALSDTVYTTTTAGSIGFLASGATHAATIANLWGVATTIAFTGTTTASSAIITSVLSTAGTAVVGLTKGQALSSSTQIAVGSYIVDIQGSTITMNINCLAAGTAQAQTANNAAYWATFTNASKTQAIVGYPYGVFPNSSLSGTGVGASCVLSSVSGNPGSLVATVSVASSAAEATAVLVTGTKYTEGMLRWPYIASQT